jgi:tRNA(Arg) A34 adenosine deaminase TadA
MPLLRRHLLALSALLAAPRIGAENAPQSRWYQAAEAMRRLALSWGDQPYGAVVVQGGRIVGEGPSRVVQRKDPEAHAEREAIRDARERFGAAALRGAVLYSTSRPCALCEEAAADAGIARMVHGAALQDAGAPVRSGAPLVEAAGRGDLAQVQALLRAGAQIEQRDAEGRTAIVAATDGNHLEVVRALIARGADVNAQDQRRDSAFLLAGARGYTEIVRATLAAGADLKSTNRYGGTALIPACHYGHVETVRLLLGTAIDVNHVNNLGWTALLEAVILGDGGPAHLEIVRLLVARKADVSRPDRDGVTPLAHARRRGQRAVADVLLQAGAR